MINFLVDTIMDFLYTGENFFTPGAHLAPASGPHGHHLGIEGKEDNAMWLSSKACNARDPGFNPWVRKIPWRVAWQPTPVLLPGESHGLRSLVGYSPQGRKE